MANMAPFKLLQLAVAATCLSAAAGQTIEATIHGVGEDYFEQGLHAFKCDVVPTDPALPSFYTACSREQAHDYGGEPVLLQLDAATENGDPFVARAEELAGIRHPPTQITKIDLADPGRKRARRQNTAGARSNLVMLINYADMDVGYATEASARVMMQNPNGMDVDELFQATTYNQQSWPAAQTTVITINSPLNGADQTGCPFMAMSQATDELIAEQHPDINLGDFIHRSYLIPSQVPGCGWGGVAYVNTCGSTGGAYCKAWIRVNSATTLAHELGHNLGTIHAADDYDDNGVQGAEYGDWGCVMGRARWTSMNAPHRVLLGYLGDGNGVRTHSMDCAAHTSHQVTLTISRLDLAPGASNPNPNMVRIARYPASDYLLSFKALADWDGNTVTSTWRNKLHIHTHDGSRVNTLIVKGLANGETFNGAAKRDGGSVPLSITVNSIDADTITVTINTDCGTAEPTRAGQTFAPTPAPTRPANFQGSIVCGQTVTGNTNTPGNSIFGNAAPDHYWTFTLTQQTFVTFNGCDSGYDTWLRVLNQNFETEPAGAEIAGCDDCGACGVSTRTRLAATIPAGTHAVLIEGWDSSSGAYSMTMECPGDEPPPTPPPTSPPTTRPPTRPPTLPPTTRPPTNPPTNPPTPPPTEPPSTNPPTPPPTSPPTPPPTPPPTSFPTDPPAHDPTPPPTPPPTEPPTTNPPTPPPTSPPSPPPTNPPTIPPSPPPTNPPTIPPTQPPTPAPSASPVSGPSDCDDNHTACVVWADLGYCLGVHSDYMTEHCASSCHRCAGNEHETPPMNTRPPSPPTLTSLPPSPMPTPRPTSSPSTPPLEQCHFTECGKLDGCRAETGACVHHSERHEVRCCSDVAISGFVNGGRQGCESAWGASSSATSGWACTSDATFDEAEEICSLAGARLCTRQELQSDCTRGTGCSHDRDLIWTGDTGTIPPGVVFAQNAGGANQGAHPTTTPEPTTTAANSNLDLASSGAASDTGSADDSSNGGAIAGAIVGTLGVIAVLGAILYVRQQNQRKKQTDDLDGKAKDDLSSANLNPLAVSGAEEEVFQLAPDGNSIRLESVQRGNPMYRDSALVASRPVSMVKSRPESMHASKSTDLSAKRPSLLPFPEDARTESYNDTLDTRT